MKPIKKLLLLIFLICCGVATYYFYPAPKLPSGIKIDRIVVEKSKRKLHVYAHGTLIKTYIISLGRNPIGDKKVEGDKKTPEGKYFINGKNPHSEYYKNLSISYPNNYDRKEAKKLGKSTGGDVKIHGLKNGRAYLSKFHRWMDWTAGCIALTNEEVEELYQAVKIGTSIEIYP